MEIGAIGTPMLWIGFNLFVLLMLAIDLGIFHRKAHVVSVKEAGIWSVVWISLAMLFNIGLYFWVGSEVALQFFTGYVIEKSLSVDNIFVFVLIFSAFAVPPMYQHRVLFWGILGALVMRGLLILTGAALLERFHWIIYVFGAFLVFTGIRMALHNDEEIHPENNPILRFLRRRLPVTETFENEHFVVRRAGKLMITPLLLVLVLVESTDLIFALDSIPAIFAVTTDPFVVYTSNVFAILGLRSLYFLLAGVMDKFYYLKMGLSAVLSFVGVKMLISGYYHIPIVISLSIIIGLLTISVIASIVRARRLEREAEGALPSPQHKI
jgi:tellurite resistance protein TerC